MDSRRVLAARLAARSVRGSALPPRPRFRTPWKILVPVQKPSDGTLIFFLNTTPTRAPSIPHCSKPLYICRVTLLLHTNTMSQVGGVSVFCERSELTSRHML